jgi:fumarate reductase subunit D
MMWVRLASAVAVIQALMTALAIPLLKSLTEQQGSVTLVIVAAVLLLLVPGVFRRPGGRWIGEAVQVFALVVSWPIPSLFILTVIFFLLWRYALRIGDRIDKDRAEMDQTDSGQVAQSAD